MFWKGTSDFCFVNELIIPTGDSCSHGVNVIDILSEIA